MFHPKVTVNEYQQKGKYFTFPDLTNTLCPHCRKDYLKKHGFYSRYFISKEFSGILFIRRHICKCCGRTVSSIPYFCHPKRAYSIDFIIQVLKQYHSTTSSLKQTLERFYSYFGCSCSRQLLYQYRKRFYRNLNFLIMSFIKIFSLKETFMNCSDKERARQLLSMIHPSDPTPCDVSMMLFLDNNSTYLTQLAL